MSTEGEVQGKPRRRDVTESDARQIAAAISEDTGDVDVYEDRMRRSTIVSQETLERKYTDRVIGDPVDPTFALTDEERLGSCRNGRSSQDTTCVCCSNEACL